ncbi:Oxidoreductase FAD/NAD(P)-binding domain protein [Desulfosarcina cetonica]|uniref:ferredoxin--NADP reductase n=1 Tax=Desulfosarcina cetonica TaxID=90730 RepID=UPI0006D1DBFD|nr:FAD-binding oxidoreductase [Desulfosarcina cetonica]VTR70203.1 Oxidoreductase FAD/NAD(P)-binding domain protein [Desulfosarcina cetonica]
MEAVNRTDCFTAEMVGRRELAEGILEVSLRRPAGFTFTPGQFVRFHMHGYQRDYTIVSTTLADTLDFCIALVDKGRFSTLIANAVPGTVFHVSGPHGHFIYQGKANPAVFVATGTGVAPFVAFCRAGIADALLLHGARHVAGLIYRRLLQSHLRSYIPCLSRSAEIPMAGLDSAFPGRVTRYLETELMPGKYDFYLCGRPGMIRDAMALIDDRFGDSRIFVETYD